MEAAGVIRGYTALVDPEKVGLHLTVMVEVNLTHHNEELVQRFEQAVAARESAAYQEALVALSDGVERDFRIVEGID